MKFAKRFIYFILFFLVCATFFGLGILFGINKFNYYVPQPDNIDLSLFWDAYYKLQKYFIDSSKIDTQKIIYGAIDGMARSLGDPYTTFFSPEEAKRFLQDLSGSFEGIGAEIGIRKNLLTIIAPLKETPAEKAGLRAGDIILKINDKDTFDMPIEEAVNLIRGPKGTSVALTILREGWKEPKEIKIIRDIITIPSVQWSLKDNDIAYIQIFQFNENLPNDFKKIAFQILQSPAKKIILDLRNNPGGYLNVAIEIAGWFLAKDEIVTIEDFGGKKEQITYTSQGNGAFANYPIVILVNEGSASGSEILAGALRDNKKGTLLIGTKTFGKGSVQELINLRDGSFLKITIAKWLTPKGHLISEVGLEPDVKIEISDKDIEQNKDPQLEKAIEIMKTIN